MSQKAAVVLILDVGYSELLTAGEGKAFIQTSWECASVTIQSKIFTNSKDEISLVLMGCKDYNHDGESNRNIHVACPLGPPTWHMVRTLKSDYNSYHKANWIEAVNVALRVLRMNMGKFSEKKIVIFTSNLKLGSLSKLADLESGISNQVVDLMLIHPCMTDDPKVAEMSSEISEAIAIVEKVGGTTYTIDAAAGQLLSFQKKKVKPRPWNICLSIGSNLLIPVSGYKKINESQRLKWDNCLPSTSSGGQHSILPERADAIPSSNVEALVENLPDSTVKVSRTTVNVSCEGKEVERHEIIEGFHFGSSIVPLSKLDKEAMGYEGGDKCLSVVKITKKKFVPRHFWIDKSSTCIVARDDDEDAAMAFSALVQALDHMESVAIVRKVYYNGNKPHMGALFPVIKPKKEYLVFVKLPFSNSLRRCLLPELKVDHLTAKQFEVIDQLIDEMDLSEPADEDSIMEREWSDLLQPHKVFDPYLQHVRKCVASRILNPGAPLPNVDPQLRKMLAEPPQPIKESVSQTLKEISRLFPNLESACDPPKKGRGKRGKTSTSAGTGNTDNDDGEKLAKQMKEERKESEVKKENGEPEVVRIQSPIEDFQDAVEQKAIPFIKVCQQMQKVIVHLVLHSFGLTDFEKPRDSLRTLRNAVITYKMDKSDSVACFNNWMKDMYQLLQEKCKMGFWNLVIQENIGFITNEECSESSLTLTEVNAILGDDVLCDQALTDEEDMPIDL